MAAAPELIPEAEVVASEGLPILAALCALITAYGIVVTVDALTRGLFGTATGLLAHVPVVGKVASVPLHKIEAKITRELGKAEHKIDGYIGGCWHRLGQVIRHVGRELELLAWDLILASAAIVELWKPKTIVHVIRGHVRPIRALQHADHALLRTARHDLRALERTVEHVERPAIRALQHDVRRIIEPEYERLHRQVKHLEQAVARAQREIGHVSKPVASKAFVAAVAAALIELGGNWIRCKNWRRLGRSCGRLPVRLIEDLLALTFDALLLRDLCQMVGVIQRIAREVAPVINELVLEVEGFICGGKQSAPSGIVASDWRRVAPLPSGIVAGDISGVTD